MVKIIRLFFLISFILCGANFSAAQGDEDCFKLSLSAKFLTIKNSPKNIFLRGWNPDQIMNAHLLLSKSSAGMDRGVRLKKRQALYAQILRMGVNAEDPTQALGGSNGSAEGVYVSFLGNSVWNMLATIAFVDAGAFIEFSEGDTLGFNRLTGNIEVPIKLCPSMPKCTGTLKKILEFVEGTQKIPELTIRENSRSGSWKDSDGRSVLWLQYARENKTFKTVILPKRPAESSPPESSSLMSAFLTPIPQKVYTPQQFATEFGKSAATIDAWREGLVQYDESLNKVVAQDGTPRIFSPPDLETFSMRVFLSRKNGEERADFSLTLNDLKKSPSDTLALLRKKFQSLTGRSGDAPIKIVIMRGTQAELPVDTFAIQWARFFIEHELNVPEGMLHGSPNQKIDVYVASFALSQDLGRLVFVHELLEGLHSREDIFLRL